MTPLLQTLGLTGGQIATRLAALDFAFMGQLLPNPDPILKATGKDIRTYREIARDSHVGACIRRRKSAVKALQWGIDRGQAPARVTRAIEDMLAGLDMERIIGNALDATLFGYLPMEIDWRSGGAGAGAGAGVGNGGGTWAADVVALPPEWFCFDAENNLRFRTRTAPLFGELLPERKFLLPRQDATYQNPYGQPDLALCYWPVVFMKGGKRFWLNFAEKFGGTFLMGKLPRGAAQAERNALLDDLEAIVQNGVGVIPDDGSVVPLESSAKAASADLFERLVLHCRSEISIVLTGTNQTIEATANKASANAGMDVAGDLRDGDAEIVAAAINQLIRWAVGINYPGAAAPTFSLWDQDAKDVMQATRDKSNYDAGARFTRQFWMRSYGYQESDLADSAAPGGLAAAGAASAAAALQPATAAFAANAANSAAAPDPTAAEQAALAAAGATGWAGLVDQVGALVAAAPDLATLQRTLTDAYGGLDTDQLTQLMTAAFALAELKGMADAQDAGAAAQG
jgi:phage gp29-like protein